jgi:hypothetical protein
MGVLTALESLPFAIFGLFAGVLVDRSRKLPLIIWADVGRALVLLAVPVAAWTGTLAMPVLYAVGFLVGSGSVVAWAAYQVFMTERVGRANLVAANSKLALSDSSAQLVGPGLAGIAIQLLTAPIAILLDAFAFLLSAWMLRGIPSRETDAPRHSSGRSVWQDIGEGLNLIRQTPLLRSIAWGVAAWNFLRHMFLAVIILFATQELQLSAGAIGAAWMAGGLGCIAASFAARRMNLHRGVGEVMLAGLPDGNRLGRDRGRAAGAAHGLAGPGHRPPRVRLRRDTVLHQLPVAAPGRDAGPPARPRHFDDDLPDHPHGAARVAARRRARGMDRPAHHAMDHGGCGSIAGAAAAAGLADRSAALAAASLAGAPSAPEPTLRCRAHSCPPER